MKKKYIILKNLALLTLIFAGFIACDKDFSNLESDVVDSNNALHFNDSVNTYSVITYNKIITPFQSNNLPANLLGYYNDPVFGSTTVNFVAQMLPNTFDPSFGENVILDSVVLSIPFFSTNQGTDDDGNITYKLDSVYGNKPIKLSVYQNNYFLRSFDPESEFNISQKYFSNGSISETNVINPSDLEGQIIYVNDSLVPSEKQIILTEIDTVTNEFVESAKLAPAIRVHLYDTLNTTDNFWQDLIFDKEGQPELSNQNNFLNYFRGLYLKADDIALNGSLMQLNFNSSDANITIYYTSDVPITESATDTEEKAGTFVLNFSGNLINFFNNNFTPIPDGDPVNGNEKLYLKGGEGAMAIINLFNGDDQGNSPEFTQFKEAFKEGDNIKRLVNEAYIEFYVDQSNTLEIEEPNRVYLYNLNTNSPLIDYFLDQSVSTSSISAKLNHLEPLTRVDNNPNGKGIKYKIRITEHINNLAIKDSTNVKLGLVVISDVNSINQVKFLNEDESLNTIPSGTILSPRGTVLFGNNTTNEEKKVKLTIYYTEPDN
jgi:Domain of unknown function (DUF4270)